MSAVRDKVSFRRSYPKVCFLAKQSVANRRQKSLCSSVGVDRYPTCLFFSSRGHEHDRNQTWSAFGHGERRRKAILGSFWRKIGQASWAEPARRMLFLRNDQPILHYCRHARWRTSWDCRLQIRWRGIIPSRSKGPLSTLWNWSNLASCSTCNSGAIFRSRYVANGRSLRKRFGAWEGRWLGSI